MPIAYEFNPDLVISKSFFFSFYRSQQFSKRHKKTDNLPNSVSAGFDAADGDLLGQCHVTPAAYGHMTHMLSSLADGKLVVALEVGPLPSFFSPLLHHRDWEPPFD